MEATIEVTNLRKRFGPTIAVDGLTFQVSPGQITGFVGPNGAGKSTTMRVILGLDSPDEGSALIGGTPYASLRRPLSHVGALLDAGANINARTKWWAGSFGVLDMSSTEITPYLIERGAYVDVHAAARLGMVERLKSLVESDAGLVHARGGDGQTPLHFAASIEIAG